MPLVVWGILPQKRQSVIYRYSELPPHSLFLSCALAHLIPFHYISDSDTDCNLFVP